MAGVVGQAAEIKLHEASRQSAAYTIQRNGQAAHADVMEFRVGIQTAAQSADQRLADILLVRDPETGLFLWRYQDAKADHPGNMIQELRADSAILVHDGKLMEFRWITPSLWVRQTSETHSSMEEGLAGVTRILETYGSSASDIPPYQDVNLARALGNHFMYTLGTERMAGTAHLREVTFRDGQWTIVFDGPNGDVKSVVLNQKLEIIPAAQ